MELDQGRENTKGWKKKGREGSAEEALIWGKRESLLKTKSRSSLLLRARALARIIGEDKHQKKQDLTSIQLAVYPLESTDKNVSTDNTVTLKALESMSNILDGFLDSFFWSRCIWVIDKGLAFWTTGLCVQRKLLASSTLF